MQYISKAYQTIQESLPGRESRSGPNSLDGERGVIDSLPLTSIQPSGYANLISNTTRVKFRERDNPRVLHTNVAKLVKVDANADVADIVHFMSKRWKLKKPRLLISVTGGAMNFPLSGQLRDSFRRGLIKASLSTNAWIISGGTDAGVMKYVGEAVRDYGLDVGVDVVAIGIATHGILDHKDELNAHIKRQQESGIHKPFAYNVQKSTSLNPNHTHFITVDTGKSEFGGEVDLRGRFVDYLVRRRGVNFHVCVLLEGGPNSLKTVLGAIESNTPVVVIRRTGRIADILADAYDADVNGYAWEDDARERIRKTTMQNDLAIEGFIDLLRKCLSHRDAFTFCNLGDNVDLPGAILSGLLRAANADWKAQLKIAMIWNRAEVAREKLFSHGQKWQSDDLFQLLHEAIANNQVEFIELFLEQGVSVQRYLTHTELEYLYNEIDKDSLLHYLLQKQRANSGTVFTLTDVSKLIKSHTFSEYQAIQHRYARHRHRPEFLKVVGQAMMLGEAESDSDEDGRYSSATRERLNSEPEKKLFTYPYQELFLYAILQDRFDMAKLFWERCKEPVAAALTATNVLKSISFWNDFSYPDECTDMKKTAKKMEEMAVGVLDECQDDNAAKTAHLLKATRPNWGNTSCIKIGFSAQNLSFTSHTSVQNILNKMWLGEISAGMPSALLWLATLFPPAVLTSVQFDVDDQEDMKQDRVSHLDDQDGVPGKKEDLAELEAKRSLRKKLQKQLSTDWDMVDPGEIQAEVFSNENGHGNDDMDAPCPNVIDDGETYSECGSVQTQGKRKLNWCSRLHLFYTSPTIKFRLHLISYFAFLCLFSYVMLVNFYEDISIPEMVLIAWVGTLFFEEVRQIVEADTTTIVGKVHIWFHDYWNRMDVLNLVVFSLGLVLRFFPSLLEAARIVLCVNLMLFYVRVLNSFLVIKSLGPKLLMIGRMMVDLLLFICILMVFLLSYGIASQAILYPNLSDPEGAMRGIVYRAYFQVFGELYLDMIEGPEGCTTNATLVEMGEPPCPSNSWTGLVLLGVYMLISNVLLLNLLIAMFSYTFSMVQENTDAFWKYHRYELIQEYIDKPLLVPPLIVLAHVYRFLRFVLSKCCGKVCGDTQETDLRAEYEAELSIMHWESLQLEGYTARLRRETGKNVGIQVHNLTKKLEKMENSFNRTQYIEKKLETVEQEVKVMHKTLNRQLELLTELTRQKGAKIESKKELKKGKSLEFD